MPPRLQYHSPNNGGASPDSGKGAFSSPDAAEPSKSSNATNQKPSAEVDDDDSYDVLDHPMEKTVYTTMEGLYRTDLGDRLAALRHSPLSPRIMS